MRSLLAPLFFVLAQLAVPRAAPAPHDSEVARLERLARVWGETRYLHPYLAYREIDWDSALVEAIPRVRAARTDDDEVAAIGAMLAALGDPVTRVVPAAPRTMPPATPPANKPAFTWLEGSVLALHVNDPALELTGYWNRKRAFEAFLPEIAKATAVILDLRVRAGEGEWLSDALESLDSALVSRPVQLPLQRFLEHSGYRPQAGTTSGGYSSAFVTPFATVVTPRAGAGPKRLVYLVNDQSPLPPLAVALQARGDAIVVAEGSLDEAQFVWTKDLPLVGGRKARLRISELEGPPGHADVTVSAGEPGPDGPAFRAAVSGLRRPFVARDRPYKPFPAGQFRPDDTYPDMHDPAVEYRLLAIFRLWNVIERFYPYKHLLDRNWGDVLGPFIVKMEAAQGQREYELTVLEMVAHIQDGHTSLRGAREAQSVLGEATPPIEIRMVEGVPAVTALLDDEAAVSGVHLGDVVVQVDGQTVAARLLALAPYLTSSTPDALDGRRCRSLVAGAEGSTATLTLRDGADRLSEVRLARKKANATASVRKGDVMRFLDGNIGYADLARLQVADVEPLFARFKDTRGIIFDMRGYPNDTAWPIAPRINVRNAPYGALFQRMLVSGDDATARLQFEQELGKPDRVYKGQTVMLIDERAISQAEHTGLFFEAAAGTRFVGSPSAGANGDVTNLSLPGGLIVNFTGHDVRHADGRQLQRVGLVPDVPVRPTLAGLRQGKDEVLERALDLLKK
jgi:C-terminal processing protease CtpA/Prc